MRYLVIQITLSEPEDYYDIPLIEGRQGESLQPIYDNLLEADAFVKTLDHGMIIPIEVPFLMDIVETLQAVIVLLKAVKKESPKGRTEFTQSVINGLLRDLEKMKL